MTERIDRNVESALAALRSDQSEWIKADVSARMLTESILKKWYECQQDPAHRSTFRAEVAKLVDLATDAKR